MVVAGVQAPRLLHEHVHTVVWWQRNGAVTAWRGGGGGGGGIQRGEDGGWRRRLPEPLASWSFFGFFPKGQRPPAMAFATAGWWFGAAYGA
jgi:hypothetical protein